MEVVVETGVLFTFDELKVLLYGMGVRTMEGIYMGETPLKDREIIVALHQMSLRGVIAVEQDGTEGDGFSIRQDVRQMLEIMAYPEETFVWEIQQFGGPEFFCYRKDEHVVVSERYWRKKDALKLRVFSEEEFEQWKGQILDDYNRN